MNEKQKSVMDELARRIKESCSNCKRNTRCPYQGDWDNIIGCSLDNYRKLKNPPKEADR